MGKCLRRASPDLRFGRVCELADSLCMPFMMFDKAEMLCRRKRN